MAALVNGVQEKVWEYNGYSKDVIIEQFQALQLFLSTHSVEEFSQCEPRSLKRLHTKLLRVLPQHEHGVLQNVSHALTQIRILREVPEELRQHPAFYNAHFKEAWHAYKDHYIICEFERILFDDWMHKLDHTPVQEGSFLYCLRKSHQKGQGNVFVATFKDHDGARLDYGFLQHPETHQWHFAHEDPAEGYALLPSHDIHYCLHGSATLRILLSGIIKQRSVALPQPTLGELNALLAQHL